MEKKIAIKLSVAALAAIVFLEFLFIEVELFEYLPNIGIFFHLFGGFFVALFTYYFFQKSLLKLPWYLIGIFIVGVVCMAAVGWEGFEWVLGRITGSLYQASLDNTMEDLFVGLAGGLLACPLVLTRNSILVKSLGLITSKQVDEARMVA
ncbi:hypothetical protein [Cytophaga hutchinsonii]|uniref:Uncharacterized protein n=1 Tax=Cytophaga hutchinsonii (strain ATCC 33406 / DSM 1761 / CIP 103989 / NBRC 15051 / NCIMB 9469 / D465) TaxID=269798 RepID=A0A6N4SPG9_CYTH3|nr:hypothetical protein [Cytophaga hutchinsonii]ABG58187.1 hypothetical protein CHU_0906 [Cytophaga hutchinsonii ATCC 33406]SFX55694.1 hypothetical protein SAMN04487930_105250 [Cytophaga hutchinsonii ATCC 33406]